MIGLERPDSRSRSVCLVLCLATLCVLGLEARRSVDTKPLFSPLPWPGFPRSPGRQGFRDLVFRSFSPVKMSLFLAASPLASAESERLESATISVNLWHAALTGGLIILIHAVLLSHRWSPDSAHRISKPRSHRHRTFSKAADNQGHHLDSTSWIPALIYRAMATIAKTEYDKYTPRNLRVFNDVGELRSRVRDLEARNRKNDRTTPNPGQSTYKKGKQIHQVCSALLEPTERSCEDLRGKQVDLQQRLATLEAHYRLGQSFNSTPTGHLSKSLTKRRSRSRCECDR